ncbi:MAG: methyltransferase domain-containing protein [Gemmatimonadaceae bacterium]
MAAKDLKRYRRKGPINTTRLLVEALRAEGVEGLTLLDIGGGVGVVHHELLAAGVREVVHVDAAPEYIEAARGEAERRGHGARVHFRRGDFVEIAPDLSAAGVVTLDRVICCYGDMPALVGASAAKAERLYGVVYPRDGVPMKALIPMANLVFRLRRRTFRVFLHASAAVDAEIRAQGLRRRSTRYTPLWQVVVYGR